MPTSKPMQTQVADDGLRYTAKASGSLFGGSTATMSCFRCGRHRPTAQLDIRRLLGRLQRVCRTPCTGAGQR